MSTAWNECFVLTLMRSRRLFGVQHLGVTKPSAPRVRPLAKPMSTAFTPYAIVHQYYFETTMKIGYNDVPSGKGNCRYIRCYSQPSLYFLIHSGTSINRHRLGHKDNVGLCNIIYIDYANWEIN